MNPELKEKIGKIREECQRIIDLNPEATPAPWSGCNDGQCQCHVVWGEDHPVFQANSHIWGDHWYEADPTPQDPSQVKREFIEYGQFPQGQVTGNIRFIIQARNVSVRMARVILTSINYHLKYMAPSDITALEVMTKEWEEK